MSRSCRRQAFTLVELVIAMSAGGVVMMLAIGVVHQAMLHTSFVCREAESLRSLDRLAAEFRRDAYRSDRCVVSDSEALQFQLADGQTVRYGVDGASVVRTEEWDEQPSRYERFSLQARHRVVFGQSQDAQRVSLTVSGSTPTSHDEVAERWVEATLGRRISRAATAPRRVGDQP